MGGINLLNWKKSEAVDKRQNNGLISSVDEESSVSLNAPPRFGRDKEIVEASKDVSSVACTLPENIEKEKGSEMESSNYDEYHMMKQSEPGISTKIWVWR